MQRIEKRMEHYVIALFLKSLQVTDSVSTARDVPLEAIGNRGIGIIDVNAFKVMFLHQVVILMYHYLTIHLSRKK